MKSALLLSGLLMLAGCTSVEDYAGNAPAMDFHEFFTGDVDGWGIVTDWRGRVTHRFHVAMHGTRIERNGEDFLRLDETFTWADGRTTERYWEVVKHENGRYSATAPDVPGGASGQAAGNAIRWRYTFAMPYKEGKTVELNMDDWMWMVDENTLMNRNRMSKWFLPVGELVITFRKKES